MEPGPEHDRLIDVLLLEQFGGEEPPDLTRHILARAFPLRRVWVLAPTLSAAALVMAALAWLLLAGRYPAPRADGMALQRGATLKTEQKPVILELGGYCRIAVAPASQLRIRGRDRAEELVLEKGELDCTVEPGQGAFAVRTGAGTVSVTGTRFVVRLLEEHTQKGVGEVDAKRMLVRVMIGAVLVSGAWGQLTLHAGEEATLPEKKVSALPEGVRGFSGMVRGLVKEKGENNTFTFSVGRLLKVWKNSKAEHPEAIVGLTVRVGPRRVEGEGGWHPVERHVAFIQRLRPGDEISLEIFHHEGDGFCILELSAEQRKPAKGALGEPGAIHASEPAYRERAGEAWQQKGRIVGALRQAPRCEIEVLDGDGRVVQAMRADPGTEAYELEWLEPGDYTLGVRTEGYRALTVALTVQARHDVAVNLEFQAPRAEPEGGAVAGIVTAKGGTWIEVKADGEQKARRYLPFWRGSGLDQEMVERLKRIYVPNRVELTWKMEEGRRIVAVEMIVPEQEEGVVTGTVSAKAEHWIEVTPEGGPPERYTPRWIGGLPKDGGGLDRDMVRALAPLQVGDRVEVKWVRDERKRVVGVRVLERREE